MVLTAPNRRIERIPVLLVGLLDEAGTLPHAPAWVVAIEAQRERPPTLEEMASLTWLAQWEADKCAGLLGYRDVYDWASGRDVREVIHVAGSARAVVELCRFVVDSARADGRRATGTISLRNHPMHVLLSRLGLKYAPRAFLKDFE